MKHKIKILRRTDERIHEVCPKGEFWMGEGYQKWAFKPECSIKHIGRQIYLVGYFDFHKAGGSCGGQDRINQYVILFPSEIAEIVFE